MQLPALDVQEARFGWSEGELAACFYPLHYEPRYAYPLLVWLHNEGGDEKQIGRIMPLLSLRNFVAIAPRSLETPSATGPTCRSGLQRSWRSNEHNFEDCVAQVMSALRMARSRFNIHARRIFLVGDGTAGTTALRLAMQFPDVFAAVASLGNGALPSGRFLGNLTKARNVPVFLSMPGMDAVPEAEQQACAALRLLHAAGFEVTLRQYFCDQDRPPRLFADLNCWLMNLVATTAS